MPVCTPERHPGLADEAGHLDPPHAGRGQRGDQLEPGLGGQDRPLVLQPVPRGNFDHLHGLHATYGCTLGL
jgi:hypothetical protein